MDTVAEAGGSRDVEKLEKKWSRAGVGVGVGVGVTDDSPEIVGAGEARPSAPSGTSAHLKPLCHLSDSPDADIIVTS